MLRFDDTGGCYRETLACRKQEIEKKGAGILRCQAWLWRDAGNEGTGFYIAKAPIDRPPSVGQPTESSILTGGRPAPAIPLDPTSSPCNRAQSTPPSDLTGGDRREERVSTGFDHETATRMRGDPNEDLRWRFSASMRANVFLQPSQVYGRKLRCNASCRLQSCWRAKPFSQPGHLHLNGRSSLWDRR